MGTSIKLNQEFADESAIVAERLEAILDENAKVEQKLEMLDAGKKSNDALLTHPLSTASAVSKLGLMAGTIPTTAIFTKLAFSIGPIETGQAALFVVLSALSIAVTGAAGYFTGKTVGPILKDLERLDWPMMMLAVPFAGAIWGFVSGAAGGVMLFGIGAVIGAAIGSATAALLLTAFAVFHRLIAIDDQIERKHFLPVSLGITLTLAAFILGL